MNIKFNSPVNVPGRPNFSNSNPNDYRVGFWAVVTKQNPENSTVNVLADTGREYNFLKVASYEYVPIQKKKYLTGQRHLPPVNSYVFCLMPEGDPSGAFVLCSGYLATNSSHQEMNDRTNGGNIEKTVKISGWNKEENYNDGSLKIANKTESETISIEVDQKTSGSEKIKITIHGNEIEVTKDSGIKIKTDKKTEVSVNQDIKVTGNNIEVSGNGKIEISGKSDISIKTTAGVSLESTTAGQVSIGNSIASLGSLISDLLDQILQLKTVGSMGPSTLSPDNIAMVTVIKAKWAAIFK